MTSQPPNTQELDQILVELYKHFMTDPIGYEGKKDYHVNKAKQATLDWHNKQVGRLLNEMLVDVADPSANIDQAEMIELINFYIHKLKEAKDD